MHVPAVGDVNGELVDLPLEREALAVPVHEVQAIIVGIHGVGEAVSSPFQSDDRLKSSKHKSRCSESVQASPAPVIVAPYLWRKWQSCHSRQRLRRPSPPPHSPNKCNSSAIYLVHGGEGPVLHGVSSGVRWVRRRSSRCNLQKKYENKQWSRVHGYLAASCGKI